MFSTAHAVRLKILATVTAVAFLTAACTSVRRVPPAQLAKLDGFEADSRGLLAKAADAVNGGAAVREYGMADERGRAIPFDERTRLWLDTAPGDGEKIIERRFRKVACDGDTFRGEPVEPGLDPVVLRLGELDAVGVREFSWGKTIGLVGGIVGGVVVTLAIAVAALPGSGGGGGGGHSDWD